MESLTHSEAEDVLTVEDYGAIRRAHRDGKPIKQIVREFGHARNTVRKALRQPQPGPPPATRERPAPVLGPFHATIDRILADDEDAPPKQRHTAAQIYRRLRDESGYRGVYAQVNRSNPIDAPTPGNLRSVNRLARLSYRPPELTLPNRSQPSTVVSNTTPV